MRLVELVVAVALAGVVGGVAWGTAWRQGRVVDAMELEMRQMAAVETATLVLDWELASGESSRLEGDELPVRGWRGWGRVCATRLDGVVVGWQGIRRPDPRRDSVMVVTSDGSVKVLELEASVEIAGAVVPGCTGPLTVSLRWAAGAVDPAVPPVWVRVFESGFYRADDALRYRRGRGGAQPLTEALLEAAATGWSMTPGGVRLRLASSGLVTERVW